MTISASSALPSTFWPSTQRRIAAASSSWSAGSMSAAARKVTCRLTTRAPTMRASLRVCASERSSATCSAREATWLSTRPTVTATLSAISSTPVIDRRSLSELSANGQRKRCPAREGTGGA